MPHVTLKSIANNPDIKEGMSRKEIDAAIARHAETETLYDQPYEDNKRVRVTGPFTVESLSPHRFISLDEEKPAAEKTAQKDGFSRQFETMILENLKKSGVQNTVKNERIKFDRLNPYAGRISQAKVNILIKMVKPSGLRSHWPAIRHGRPGYGQGSR